MAKATEITVEVKVAVPNETVHRCLRVLEMWMDDNPDDTIIVNRERDTEGNYHHAIHIERMKAFKTEPVFNAEGNSTGEYSKIYTE